jgi:hypothetical protein
MIRNLNHQLLLHIMHNLHRSMHLNLYILVLHHHLLHPPMRDTHLTVHLHKTDINIGHHNNGIIEAIIHQPHPGRKVMSNMLLLLHRLPVIHNTLLIQERHSMADHRLWRLLSHILVHLLHHLTIAIVTMSIHKSRENTEHPMEQQTNIQNKETSR